MTTTDVVVPGQNGRRTRFTVLGMLTVTDGQETVVLQPSRPAALLAALLLHANSVVSAELLQRVIWGEETPAQAKSALHSCVLRLRRLFGKYGVADNAIEAVPGGYRLTADAQTLDLVEFRELLVQAYSAGDQEKELALLRTALALWQSPLLGNVPSDLLHRDEVPRLEEDWLRAIERVFDLELGRGRYREALAEIWPAARAHPLHERFTEQLMEALHRTGRRAEALAEYRKAKDHLAQQLGVDPGPALQQLEMAILRGEAGAPGPSGGAPAGRTASPARTAGGAPAEDADPISGDQVLERLVRRRPAAKRGRAASTACTNCCGPSPAPRPPTASAAGPPARSGTGPTSHPSPRQGAAELHPTEA